MESSDDEFVPESEFGDIAMEFDSENGENEVEPVRIWKSKKYGHAFEQMEDESGPTWTLKCKKCHSKMNWRHHSTYMCFFSF